MVCIYCCVKCHDDGDEWWHTVTMFYLCGWTTVVLNILFHHGGVVWSCYERSWLSHFVQCCCQTISWLLPVWVGRRWYFMMCAAMVVCGDDVAVAIWTNVCCHVLLPNDVGWCCHTWGWLAGYHAATSGGGMDECLLPCLLPHAMMRGDVVVDGIDWCVLPWW